MFFFLSPRPAQTTIETRQESLSTMPHALLVSPCTAATARRLSAITASTLGRSSQAAPASASGLSPQRPRSERFDAAATSTNAAICRLHQPHRRLLPPPRAVKKTYTSFDDMIKESPVPVLVDFHANWCGPCKLMGENVKDCANRMGGDVKIVKIDTDAYPALASRFGVRALPTLLLFVDGVAVDRVEGVLGGSQLAERVRYYALRLDRKFGRR